MPAGACSLDGPRTKSMDDKTAKFREFMKHGSGFSTFWDILSRSRKIYDSTKNLEPHVRLGG